MRLVFNGHQIEVLNRTFIAVVGGSTFSILFSLLISFLLPIEKMHAVAWSTMLVFVVFPAVVMWAFGAKNYKNTALCLLAAILFCAGACWLVAPLGAF